MRIFLQSGEEVAESGRLGRAQLLANFVHELDDAWLGFRQPSRSRKTASIIQIRRIPASSGFGQNISVCAGRLGCFSYSTRRAFLLSKF